MEDDDENAPARAWGEGVEGVRTGLQQLLREYGETMSIADMLALFGRTSGSLIDFDEFSSAMAKRFGYAGPPETLQEVFDSCDKDKSGRIGVDELYCFVRGVPRSTARSQRSRQLVTALKLQPKVGEPGVRLAAIRTRHRCRALCGRAL